VLRYTGNSLESPSLSAWIFECFFSNQFNVISFSPQQQHEFVTRTEGSVFNNSNGCNENDRSQTAGKERCLCNDFDSEIWHQI
jgi:hypothetical protein